MDATELTGLLQADGEIITERLDHWAATAAHRVFFHYGEDDVTLTYAEFARRTDSIAGNPAGHGIEKGDRVSVFCTNSLVRALMMFGIWKAGAVYCPINFAYTGRLLSYQLNDTAPRLLLTDSQLLPVVNDVASDLDAPPAVVVYDPPAEAHDHVGERADVDRAFAEIGWSALTAPTERPDVTVSFYDPANVVYTSGTTGPAKGVVQPYRRMAQYTYAPRAVLTEDDVIYSDLPMYHVGGAIANIGRAAWVGCEVAVWDRFSATGFWSRVQSRGVTAAILLDVMIPRLMRAPKSETDRHNPLDKVYMQPLPLHHAQVARRFGFDFVSAGFGQTETGNPLGVLIEETAAGAGTPDHLYRGLSHAEVAQVAAARGIPLLAGDDVTRKGVMGLPGPFADVAVLDNHDRECAVEEAGELALRPRLPSLVMIEYLGKPEATANAWRNSWLHTGDATVRGADGLFYFVDRLGDRIRVRGENLSSIQVEDLINQHPKVQYCAVFAIRNAEGDEDDVVACVVADDAELTEDEIHAFAAEAMPKYMRPRIVRILDDVPRTAATNKIEKHKLRQQVITELASSDDPGRSTEPR